MAQLREYLWKRIYVLMKSLKRFLSDLKLHIWCFSDGEFFEQVTQR